MRYWESRTPYEERELRGGISMVSILIIINVSVLIIQFLFQLKGVELEKILGLVPTKAVGSFYLWQFVTYNFLHSTSDVMHILINMLMLYFFGRQLELTLGRRKFLTIYLACGIYAGLCYAIYQYVVGGIAYPVIGASGAVMGIMVMYAAIWPNDIVLFFFIIPMKVWLCVAIFVAIDLFYTLSRFETGVATAAHLGGAVCGLLIYLIEPMIENYFYKTKAKIDRMKFMREFELQKEVDEILDKINKQGMQSLTSYEKRVLEKASKTLSKRE